MHDQLIYGTYPLMGAALAAAVAHAMTVGYRAFDTAQTYGNESDLGGALRHSGAKRTDFRVTTKIAPPNYTDLKFLPSLRRTLTDLQLDYVDLLLLHFPPDSLEIGAALKMLASAQEAGLARAVGVSNFTPAHMRKAAQLWNGALAINQVEFHPLLDGRGLLSASVETGIPLQAYSPLARGAVFSHTILHEIARRHDKTVAQITLRWILQQGLSVVTQSANPTNIASNLESTTFSLSDDDMRLIETLSSANYRIINNRTIRWAPAWD